MTKTGIIVNGRKHIMQAQEERERENRTFKDVTVRWITNYHNFLHFSHAGESVETEEKMRFRKMNKDQS